MTTSPPHSNTSSAPNKRTEPHLKTVPLSRLTIDRPASDEVSVPARFADLKAVPELVAVVTALRPPVVIPVDRPGWYQVVGNTEVVDWLRYAFFFGDDEHRSVPVLIIPATMAGKNVLDAASRYLIPLVFDELKDVAGRRAKRELTKAGLTVAARAATVSQRLKPIFHT